MSGRTRVLLLTVVVALMGAGNLCLAAANTWLITPAWLAERLGHEPIVMLHLGDRAEYDAGHIANAQFMTLQDISEPPPPATTLRLQMASIDALKNFFEARGVTDTSRIVLVYGKDQITSVARVFVALDLLGLADRTSVLDGGLPAWRAAGQPVTANAPAVTRGTFTPHPRTDVIAGLEWVSERLKDSKVQIVDARTHDYFTGENTRGFPRPGHVAGAVNIPYTTVNQESAMLKDAAALRVLFEAQGIKPDTQVVTYCHIGQQASAVYFVAKLLGYNVRLYDGSFEEWSAATQLPVETGEAKKIIR